MERQVDIFHIEILGGNFVILSFWPLHVIIYRIGLYMKHIAALQIVIYALYCKVLYRRFAFSGGVGTGLGMAEKEEEFW